MEFSDIIDDTARVLDLFGVFIIVVALLGATGAFIGELQTRSPLEIAYRSYRRRIGKGILLGLEVLVAADIIRTVAATPTFRGVGVLALIVVVRTFLSMTLQLEVDGQWPWQRRSGNLDEPTSAA